MSINDFNDLSPELLQKIRACENHEEGLDLSGDDLKGASGSDWGRECDTEHRGLPFWW